MADQQTTSWVTQDGFTQRVTPRAGEVSLRIEGLLTPAEVRRASDELRAAADEADVLAADKAAGFHGSRAGVQA